MSSHTGERKYKCDVCSKSFKYLSKSSFQTFTNNYFLIISYLLNLSFDKIALTFSAGLWAHKRAHSGERPFICDICSKNFINMSMYEVSMFLNVIVLDFIKFWFLSMFSGDLRRHIRIHTNLRPHKCNVCSRGFKQGGKSDWYF